MQFTPSVNSLVILATNNSVKNQEKGLIPFLEIFNSLTGLNGVPATEGAEVNSETCLTLCKDLASLLKEFNQNDEEINKMTQDELSDALAGLIADLPAEKLIELETIVIEAKSALAEFSQAAKTISDITPSLKLMPDYAGQKIVLTPDQKNAPQTTPLTDEAGKPETVQTQNRKADVQPVPEIITAAPERKEKLETVRVISAENEIGYEKNSREVINFRKIKAEFESQFKNFLHENVKEFREVLKKEGSFSSFRNDIEVLKSTLKESVSREELVKKPELMKFTEKMPGNSEVFVAAADNKSIPADMRNVLPMKAAVETGENNIVSQIVEKIDLKNMEDGSIINVKLKPDSLGSISIKVQTMADGIKAEIITDNVKVREVVMKQLNELTMSLQEKGIRTDSIKVTMRETLNYSFGQYSNGSPDTYSQNRFNQNHLYYKSGMNVVNQEEPVESGKETPGGSLVNIYV